MFLGERPKGSWGAWCPLGETALPGGGEEEQTNSAAPKGEEAGSASDAQRSSTLLVISLWPSSSLRLFACLPRQQTFPLAGLFQELNSTPTPTPSNIYKTAQIMTWGSSESAPQPGATCGGEKDTQGNSTWSGLE